MNPLKIWIVFRKELLDILRDRRTVIFMILMPLIMMPALIWLMSQFTLSSAKGIAEQNSRVAIVGAEDAPELVAFLTGEEKQRFEPPVDSEFDIFMVEGNSGVNSFIDVTIEPEGTEEGALNDRVKGKDLDAVLVVPPGFESQLAGGENNLSVRINYVSTNERSEKAFERLRKSLGTYHRRVVDRRLAGASLAPAAIEPFETSRQDLASGQEKAGELFGRMLPYLIILMTMQGAMFPAISLAAGEKEQKTLETLLSSPASRMELVTGKFGVIVLTGIISALLSLIGLYYGMSMGELGNRLKQIMDLSISVNDIVLALLLVVPLALVFAGVLLTISVFARSYREAQSYMGPLMMVVIIPAFASFLPGVELDFKLALVPVVNVSLVLKEILVGKAMEIIPYYIVTFVSTLVIAVVAIWLCARMFKNENAIFKI